MIEAEMSLKLMFGALAIALGCSFVASVYWAWRRTGAAPAAARRVALITAAGVVAWLGVTFAAAASGRLRFDVVPPTMMFAVLAMIVVAIGLARSGVGERLAAGLPLALLVGIQGFRLPLELMMHRAYSAGVMPVQMSFSGYNFDILTGIGAIVVAVLVAFGRAGRPVVRAWNWLGMLLLINVMVIALLSAPTPLRVFHNEPANIWVTQAPFVWLPMVMVLMALMGHLVIFRRLRAAT
jgi:hypothetical protein